MHLRCMTEYVRRNFYNLQSRLLCRTFASQIYDNAWFPLTPFPCHTRKSCRIRVSRTSCVLIFSLYVRRNQMPASLSLGFFPHYSILERRQTYDRKKRTSQSTTAKSFVLVLFNFMIGYSVSFSCGCWDCFIWISCSTNGSSICSISTSICSL